MHPASTVVNNKHNHNYYNHNKIFLKHEPRYTSDFGVLCRKPKMEAKSTSTRSVCLCLILSLSFIFLPIHLPSYNNVFGAALHMCNDDNETAQHSCGPCGNIIKHVVRAAMCVLPKPQEKGQTMPCKVCMLTRRTAVYKEGICLYGSGYPHGWRHFHPF